MIAPAVVLLTDFGWRDPWVAEVKGVLLSVWNDQPEHVVRPLIVDGGHDIPPGDVAVGTWFLGRLVPRFPPGSVFLAVVDPGVGTERPAVAVAAGESWCVGPGNGLLAQVATGRPALLTGDPAGGPVSNTFHGRDLFAPAAARLALGIPLDQLGREGRREDLGTAPPVAPGPSVRWIDRFGNAITDLSRDSEPGSRLAAGGVLGLAGHAIPGPFATYEAAPPDLPFWYWGSGGTLEVAVPGGNAAATLDLYPGLVLDVTTL
ncbi:MAG: SAM-dependent chlorinase/fluorinase [bacterium]|nr:SAM-dependent chlorinase/fluorinase [bacterium]